MENNNDLGLIEESRDYYYKIKAGIQVKNAQIERERVKLEKQI
jgi:hypothetical protein